jgi:hypothetical protein
MAAGYGSNNQSEPPRSHCIIQDVDIANKKATAIDINLNKTITIWLSLTPAGQIINWPRQSEEWYCTQINGNWVLEYKAAFGNEGFSEEAQPGDIVLGTNTGNIVIRGNNVRLANGSVNDIIGALQNYVNLNLFGSNSATQYPYAAFTTSGNYTVTNSDAFVVGVTAISDPGHLLTVGTSNTAPSYFTVPVTGRYNVVWHACGSVTMPANTGAVLISRISLNSAAATASVAVNSQYFYASGAFTWNEVHIESQRNKFFNAGDKIYFSNWIGGGSFAVVPTMMGMQTYAQLQYLGQT